MKYEMRYPNPIFPRGEKWREITYDRAVQEVREVVKTEAAARAMLARETLIKCRCAEIRVSGQ